MPLLACSFPKVWEKIFKWDVYEGSPLARLFYIVSKPYTSNNCSDLIFMELLPLVLQSCLLLIADWQLSLVMINT